jgi:putative tricarboxylic transport membrane protein
MSGESVDFLVHGPSGSAPPLLAAAFRDAVAEGGGDTRAWRLVDKGGDPGVDAMRALVTRPGDGAVLSTCTPVFLQAPLLRGMELTHRALTPLARLVADRYLVVARADAPFADPQGFLAELKRRTTRTGGYFTGGINHLLALDIAARVDARVDFIVVHSEPAVWTALIEGRIDWGCGVLAEVKPHLEAGTFRAVAALDTSRLPALPDVPTLGEAGAEVTFKLWRGLMGPPGLDAAQQARWHAIVAAVRATSAWRNYLKQQGQTDDPVAGEGFVRFLETEWDWYARQFARAGLLPSSSSP